MFFNITAIFKRVTDITPEILKKLGIKGLILDIDNTLAKHNNPEPAKGVMEWLDCMKRHNIRLVLLSNNFYSRVKTFAERIGLDYIIGAKKPFQKSYQLAAMKMKLPKNALAAVGDQFFTDVLGANLFNIKMFYTMPICDETSPSYRLRKTIENIFINREFRNEQNEIGYNQIKSITYNMEQGENFYE